ncbi:hypothetical protein [Hymenobacter arizonensis]|uniref:Uncharacterized protein n=1 Tax=Hymenobacter arizonensis TaxID=1227077 RepID=A0A1I6BLA1_HYMAR|nr:hypothetical protein [Hymenobacter arizonensis]SFQ81706.1 hypothetical protein SAMN04515668_4715 [Hymenobacter arizonensis]
MEPTLKITFSGWKVGMRSLRFAQLLRHQAGLGLKEAWDIKTRVLDHVPVVLELPAPTAADLFAQATALGVICTLEANT